MKKRTLSDLFFYRWRYVIGYGLLVILFISLVAITALYAPGGISQKEIDLIQRTNEISLSNLDSLAIANLPLHLLQYVLFSLFGVSVLTIKLPSIIFSIVAAVAIFFLLRRWFKPNVVVMTLLLMTVSSQFVFISQSFSSHILYATYLALMLLFVTLILQRARFAALWKIGLALSISLSLLTPYFWFINLAFLVAALLHPRTRYYILGKKHRAGWIIPSIIILATVAAIGLASLKKPSLLHALSGIEEAGLDLVSNLKIILKTYFWTEPFVYGGRILPIMDFSALLIVLLGIMQSFNQRHTARSYMVWSWLILSIPLLLVRPGLSTVSAIPIFILMAIGIETLFGHWYRLFPKNPYARGSGLVLIIGLVSIMVMSGLDRHINGYLHMPEVAHEFNKDSKLINHHLNSESTVYISEREKPLYDAISTHNPDKDFRAITDLNENSNDTIYVTNQATDNFNLQNQNEFTLNHIITDGRAEHSDRLRVYTRGEK